MKYGIGEVAKTLHISKEMIRYYEKQGVLKPIREDNNYRMYSETDIIVLLEMLHYQSIGFTIKETIGILDDNCVSKYEEKLESYHKQLLEEISFKNLLTDHIKEIRGRLKTCQMNIGKYWFKEIPAYDLYFICNENNDSYNHITLDEFNSGDLLKKGYLSFCDSVVLFEKEQNTWWYGINGECSQVLHVDAVAKNRLERELCLCTVIDMGEMGTFNRKVLEPIEKYITENKLAVNGIIRGVVICRGNQNGKYQRLLEIQVPIKQ